MKVTLITSCFNRVATIEQTIKSVLWQSYPDIEYIVVDGASTDGTMDVVRWYGSRISKVVSEPDHGIYEGINKGLRMATGDIIGLVHSDDFLFSPHVVEDIVKLFERTKADFVYGNGLFVDPVDTDKIIRNWISGRYSKKKVKYGWLPLHPTCYIKTSVIRQLGDYDESYKIAADSDLLVRYLYEHRLHVEYLNEYIVRMRVGGASTSWKKQKEKWKEDLRMYRSHGLNPYLSLSGKILSKIPQFLKK